MVRRQSRQLNAATLGTRPLASARASSARASPTEAVAHRIIEQLVCVGLARRDETVEYLPRVRAMNAVAKPRSRSSRLRAAAALRLVTPPTQERVEDVVSRDAESRHLADDGIDRRRAALQVCDMQDAVKPRTSAAPAAAARSTRASCSSVVAHASRSITLS